MKTLNFKSLFIFSAFVFSCLNAVHAHAHAEYAIELNYIDTNNCNKARAEVLLLSGPNAMVNATCSDYSPGGYSSNNGRSYDYRLFTTVNLTYDLQPGQAIELNSIFTNNCQWAQSEIMLLNSDHVAINATCSPYIQNGYKAGNGRLYNYKLTTTLTLRN